MRKKGDLSLNFIVIAALAVIVLIIIALYFTGGLQKLFTTQKDVIGLSTQEKALSRAVCTFSCSQGDRVGYNSPDFTEEVKAAGYTTCEDLTDEAFDDVCVGKSCVGEGDCSTSDMDECLANGCSWE